MFEQISLFAGTLVSNKEWLIKIGSTLILLKNINTDFLIDIKISGWKLLQSMIYLHLLINDQSLNQHIRKRHPWRSFDSLQTHLPGLLFSIIKLIFLERLQEAVYEVYIYICCGDIIEVIGYHIFKYSLHAVLSVFFFFFFFRTEC